MVKPWEMDWSTDAPAPDAMPLPIVPFFGRQMPPMLGAGRAGMDAGAVPAAGAYGMVAADPSVMPPAGLSALGFGDPLAGSSDGASAIPFGAPAVLSPAPAFAPSTAGPPTPPLGFSAAGAADLSAPPQQASAPAIGSPRAPFLGAQGMDGPQLLQPALDSYWNATNAQTAASPAPGRAYAGAPPFLLAAQQAEPSNGSPLRAKQSGMVPGLSPPPRPGAPINPQAAAKRSDQAADPTLPEIRYEANITGIVKSATPSQNAKPRLILDYMRRAGRPINPEAVNRLMQIAGNGEKIGGAEAGQILSFAQRAARLRDRLMLSGFNPKAAAALAANAMVESRAYYRMSQESGGPGYGLWQWSPIRRDKFEQLVGKKFSDTAEDDQIRYLWWELNQKPFAASLAALQSDQGAGEMARTVALNYEGMADKINEPPKRAAIAEVLGTIPFDPTRAPNSPASPPPEFEAATRRRARR
ncbi:MAG: hypothetical protein JWO81_1405 [Alphaproteobacteria bacterium]|nr:hypothetical protein [Alphaproteobacteria bacterium]